jgi:hypothetical protein
VGLYYSQGRGVLLIHDLFKLLSLISTMIKANHWNPTTPSSVSPPPRCFGQPEIAIMIPINTNYQNFQEYFFQKQDQSASIMDIPGLLGMLLSYQ